jgi:hypothetical protein
MIPLSQETRTSKLASRRQSGRPKSLGLHAILIQMKSFSCLPLCVFLAVVAQDAPSPASNQVSAVNFLQVEKDVCTSGQPSSEDLQRLRQDGVRSPSISAVRKKIQLDRPTSARSRKSRLRSILHSVNASDVQPEQVENSDRS